MTKEFLENLVIVKIGDITKERTEAIVNAANWTLLGGGGVDGAIHRKGGGEILRECKKIRETQFSEGLPTGEAVITTGGNLSANYVIHTVGPIYGCEEGKEAFCLKNSYLNCLKLAASKNLSSIAFPSISTGAFSYPKHEAAKIVSKALREFAEVESSIKKIKLVFFSDSDFRLFLEHQNF